MSSQACHRATGWALRARKQARRVTSGVGTQVRSDMRRSLPSGEYAQDLREVQLPLVARVEVAQDHTVRRPLAQDHGPTGLRPRAGLELLAQAPAEAICPNLQAAIAELC